MKLYATITSERASKGQGGNEWINLELRSGSTKDSKIAYYLIFTLEGLIVQYNNGILLDTTDSEGQKGKRQKDDPTCIHGSNLKYDNCLNCDKGQ